MGTWGTGSFDNDDASDFISELEAARGVEILERTLRGITEGEEYIEAPECQRAVAAAEVVAVLAGAPLSDLPDEVREWSARQGDRSGALPELAIDALDRIRASSELKDLYIESDLLDGWLAAIADLETRLRG